MNDIERQLREALHAEAAGVQPRGDGLTRIQQRVAAPRRPWLRPALAGLTALALAAAGAGAWVTLSGGDSGDVATITPAESPRESPSEEPSPSATATPSATPANAPLWPVGSTAAGDWQRDPASTAKHFMDDYLQMPAVDQKGDVQVDSTHATVQMGRVLPSESKKYVVATTVSLDLDKRTGLWWVTGASADYLSVTQPAAHDGIGSPVTLSGRITGVDESVRGEVRDADGKVLGSAFVGGGGQDSPWSVQVTYSGAPAAVVAWTASALDGAPQRVVVVPVSAAASPAGPGEPTGSGSYPATVVGAVSARIAVLSSTDGTLVRYLTDRQPGGGDSDPRVVGDQVYFLRGGGTCANSVMRVPLAGGTATSVYAPQGATVGGYDVSSSGDLVMTLESCTDAGAQKVLVMGADGRSNSTAFRPSPPMVVGNPSWAPDGRHVAAVVRTGNLAGVSVWDAWAMTTITSGGTTCGPQGDMPVAVTYDGDRLVAAYGTGGQVEVRSCSTGGVVFTVGANDVSGLDSDGHGHLVTTLLGGDSIGGIAIWDGTKVRVLDTGGCTSTDPAPYRCPTQPTW